ncbi:YoaK family protein [Streptomyces sp. BE133]|uniref:YoaK family protein n=1 Tax=Streptomyces sp. BE133 TaxID=3002523 RepID=UPI003FA7403C
MPGGTPYGAAAIGFREPAPAHKARDRVRQPNQRRDCRQLHDHSAKRNILDVRPRATWRDALWLTPPSPTRRLTLVTGAGGAISFLALGGVFTGAMTANLALLGLAVGSRDLTLAGHALVAFGGYICGALAGTRSPSEREAHWEAGFKPPWPSSCWSSVASWSAGWPPPECPDRERGSDCWHLRPLPWAVRAGWYVSREAPTSMTYLTGTLTGLLGELVTTRRL